MTAIEHPLPGQVRSAQATRFAVDGSERSCSTTDTASGLAVYGATVFSLTTPAALAVNGPSPSQISLGGVAPPPDTCWKCDPPPVAQGWLWTCEAYWPPGCRPCTWMVANVDPSDLRTSWARPVMSCPAPAVRVRNSP